ncbi:MAG: AFG1 family ATPase [Alphaproteobacteria bacterium]|jgi:cell division protein ZapE|nr:AFG1 family ATPase [Alphaproteobacteria bacterium]
MARYRRALTDGALRPDAAQQKAAEKLHALARALTRYRPGWFSALFRKPSLPRGLYIWGDVGRGKSMLMDLFFEEVTAEPKRRVHFNAFMTEVHARLHVERGRSDAADPIPSVARALAQEARLLCFDEFQVTDVADAMILGRLFEHLLNAGTVIVATSNVAPSHLYEGGLNRQLFLPFIALIEARMDVLELKGATDYRLHRLSGHPVYLSPLSKEADAAMDAAWRRLTDCARGNPMRLTVFGRTLLVPQAARGVARFSFADLCEKPLAAADYLEIARQFHTVLVDHIPMLDPRSRDAARRFVLLIDTLYDQGVKLICSAQSPPDRLYPEGDGAEAFRRTASRLAEMQSDDYLSRGHGISSP